MPLTRSQKENVVSEVSDLLSSSKLTVLAVYSGISVKAMQLLRAEAKQSNTTVRVIKNRLVIKALDQSDRFKEIDKSLINGQILYAFNPSDEVAPAQALANFAKTNPTLEFVGALSSDGTFMPATDVQVLASLSSKDQLRGQLIGVLSAPAGGLVNVLSGKLRSVLNVLSARSEVI